MFSMFFKKFYVFFMISSCFVLSRSSKLGKLFYFVWVFSSRRDMRCFEGSSFLAVGQSSKVPVLSSFSFEILSQMFSVS